MNSTRATQAPAESSVNENLVLFQSNARMIWQHRWAGLCMATFLCVIGWIGVFFWPNQYEVSAKVFVDTNSTLKPLLRGLALESDIRENTALMVRRTLLSRPNLETVARDNDMDLKAETPREFEALITSLAEKIAVTGTLRDNIFDITYRSGDAELATRVVSSLLNLFVERTLGENRKDSSKTREFLDRQIADYETKLEAAEVRLKNFKQRNVGVMPSEEEGYYRRLQATSDQLLAAQLTLEEARMRRDELQRQLQLETTTISPDPQLANLARELSPLEGRIVNLETQLDSLVLQYTDQHPDVVSLRRMLKELKEEQKQVEAQKSEQDVNPGMKSPVYQDLKVALSQAEGEVAALAARVTEFSRRERDLQAHISTIPAVEAELARLNRDYAVNRENYEELVKRRESLSLAQDVSYTTDEVQFRVVEPPRRPLLPASPDREKLNVLVLVLGLAGGISFSWLLVLLHPRIYTKEDVFRITDLPVLGVVSQVWTPGMLFRRRAGIAVFCMSFLILLSLFAGVYAMEVFEFDLRSAPEILTRLKYVALERWLP